MTALADAVDRIILDVVSASGAIGGEVAVLQDASGALATGLQSFSPGGQVRAYCDSLADEAQVRRAASDAGAALDWHTELGPALSGATVVALRLPKSLAALDELAEAVARFADPRVRLYAGGRVKHMTRGMNQVLSRHFGSVSASLGQQKSRVLIAHTPQRRGQSTYPRKAYDADLDLTVCAHGPTFAGTSVDLGTRFLASFLDRIPVSVSEVVDLGCGTGVLAALVARSHPSAHIQAVDEALSACASTVATAKANGLGDRIDVTRMDLLSDVTDHSVDVVVCNPPFHRGTARDSDAAFAMFGEAARTLRPSGELWTVFNSHLPYLPALRRRVGSTSVIGQNTHYVVTRSTVARPRSPAGT